MTQEDKDLLLRDLCARLPYGVKVMKQFKSQVRTLKSIDVENYRVYFVENDVNSPFGFSIENPLKFYQQIKPYLRPMSSMTEKEKRELQSFYPGGLGNQWLDTKKGTIELFECSSTITLYLNDSERIVDWLNKKMFDFRGLIPKSLAIEAKEGMYDIK